MQKNVPKYIEKEVIKINIAYFLIPKKDTAFLYDDYTLRQALEKMRAHGYTRIPVISRDGKYINVVGEGDFLWFMIDNAGESGVSMASAENLRLADILKRERPRPYKSVRITAGREELIRLAMNQNFIPVTDDDGGYIGIVTRRNIIRHFVSKEVSGIASP